MLDLHTKAETVAHINRRLDSREWWLFVTNDPLGHKFIERIENTYYLDPDGRSSDDFELLLCPVPCLGVIGLSLGRKRRLLPGNLSREMDSLDLPVRPRDLLTRDVIFPCRDIFSGLLLSCWLCNFLDREP